jgi:hypothetical protein
VARVHVTYSGGGDSGQVDSVEFYTENGVNDPVPNPFGSALIEKRFEDFIYDVLDHRGWDYNNEGCQGSMDWDLEEDTFTHHHEINVTQVEATDHDEADDLIAALDPDNPRS